MSDIAQTALSDEAQREDIKAMLASGLRTEVYPRADNHDLVQEIVKKLQVSDQELKTKLIISGFTLTPVEHGGVEQLCENCMYFQVHRKFCDLPEHDFPVEAQWSCRLWRI